MFAIASFNYSDTLIDGRVINDRLSVISLHCLLMRKMRPIARKTARETTRSEHTCTAQARKRDIARVRTDHSRGGANLLTAITGRLIETLRRTVDRPISLSNTGNSRAEFIAWPSASQSVTR